jgi:ubiquinone/menaquinone biosynthesis C-methylase UbiE
VRRAEGASEFLDRPVPAGDRDASLADIDRLNAWFGGYRLTLRALGALAARATPAGEAPRRKGRRSPRPAPAGDSRALHLIDVGGGRGDFARRVLAWAERTARPVRVVVVDRDGDLLGRAVAATGGRVRAVRADATALPFREGAVDVVIASLTLHHLEPDAAVRCLGEMRAVARAGVIVNDLLRTPLTLALVWVATRLLARHRFARHDGPLSVRRAYSPEELQGLAEKAGLPALVVHRYPLLGRVVAVGS